MHCINKKEITDISDIDWNELIKIQRKKRPPRSEPGKRYWDKRAASFVDHAGKTTYPDAFLKMLEPQSDWTVLDMGCGGGTLALPLSDRVKEVTAVDYSDKMLEMLGAEIQRRDIKNIRLVKASWDDDWANIDIGHYDIAIASRSLSIDDIETAVFKLNGIAMKRIYLSTVVGDGPFDRRIFQAIGRELIPSVDYIYIYNLLYQMGIYANISFIAEENSKTFDDVIAARDYMRWMITDMDSDEEYRLEKYILENMVIKGGKRIFEYKKSFKWAVIWWDRERIA